MNKNNIDLNISYNPRQSVIDYDNLLKSSKIKAKNALKFLHGSLDTEYGQGPLQKLDVFYKKKKSNLPIHIFIHGGYWRALDKSYHTHMALPFYENNIAFFNLNYDLCPKVTLSEIKNQIIEAILWIIKNGKKFNADTKNIVLSGHSAGAHLISMLLCHNWKEDSIDENIFKGAGLISGIFNTELVLKLNINNEIKLSKHEAISNNSFRKKPILKIPSILAYGKDEPKKWIEQTKMYGKWLKENGFDTTLIECKNYNHFSLIDMLANSKNVVVKKLMALSQNTVI